MRGALLLVIASACAPAAPHNGSCLFWTDCGEGGACEFSVLHSAQPFRGECSFPDDSCETGRRFGEFGGEDVAGSCVDFYPSLDGRCDGDHPCAGAFDCQLGRCINVKQLDGTTQLSGGVCADDKADALPGGDLYLWGLTFIDEDMPPLIEPVAVFADSKPLAAGSTKGPFQTKTATIGRDHACIVSALDNGAPFSDCFGRNANEAVGGNPANPATWASPTPDGPQSLLAASKDHTCGVKGLAVECWGKDENGQLGDNVTATGMAGAATVFIGKQTIGAVTALTTGDNFSCAGTDTDVWCWGGASNWTTGTFDGTRGSVTTVKGLDAGPVLALAGGATHACAIKGDHQLWCWGLDDAGQVDGVTSTLAVDPAKPLGDQRVLGVATGAQHTCAVLEDNTVQCWGSNVDGKLGSPEPGNAPRAVPLPSRAIGLISATDFTTCVVLEDTFVHCWGAASLTTEVTLGSGPFTLAQFPICLL